MSNNRSKLACASCTRRKVKCSKTVPCTNCVRRGEQDECGLGLDPASPTATDSQPTPPRRPSSPARLTNQEELDLLRHRIAELEDRVRNSTPAVPETSPVQDEESPSRVSPVSPRPHPSSHATEAVADRTENTDAVVKHAASILEFLAWGRRKDPDYDSVVSPEATVTLGKASGDVRESTPDGFDECPPLAVVQLLLPSPRQVWQLFEYHDECLLWYHGSFFSLTFRTQLEAFYTRHHGVVDSPGVNLQWVALLFSIMAASLFCSPPSRFRSWGFRDPERSTLSKRWFRAVLTCLTQAEYTANLSILSCQAIATSTISAHLLGFSNSQSIHLAAAVRIAQSLGLHRLGSETASGMVEKEVGRRVWCQLCSQDWFGVPFSESYIVNPLYSSSEPPVNCHDHDMLPLPVSVPTITSYCRFLREVACIMPQLQDDLMVCNTAFTRYEQVLAWDAHLRALVTTGMPSFLSNAPIEPEWPSWIPWARRALAISSSHKIIMIHRSFLSDSFINPAFAFTRRTCLAASKTIIKEYKCVVDEDGPILWIHQAFSIAASIILLLDVLHRDPSDRDSIDHRQLVEEVVEILRYYRSSMIASRGIRLLGALLAETSKAAVNGTASSQGLKRRRNGAEIFSISRSSGRRKSHKFDVPAFVKTFCEENTTGQPSGQARTAGPLASPPTTSRSEDVPPTRDDSELNQADVDFVQSEFNYSFPPAGLDGANDFENLLYLANHDCFI